MLGSHQAGPPESRGVVFATILMLGFAAVIVSSLPSTAQINGVAPSVTSIPMSHFSPNPRPSVTSLGPFGYGFGPPGWGGNLNTTIVNNMRQFPYTRPYGHHRGGTALGGYGYGYTIPYYLPYDNSGYGYDYVAGSDTYAGPPNGPADPTLHIVVEQPPAAPLPYRGQDERAPTPSAQQPEAAVQEDKPVAPTTLVFRDGHRQEVTNYAIMGQMVWVFGDTTKKVALSDLDVAATVKANDDRGIEFKVPAKAGGTKKNSTSPQSGPGSTDSTKPSSTATLMP
jgi:hypothetical protein